VDGLVEGAAQRSGNRVLITAQLIEGSTDRHLWAKSYERDLRDTLALQNEVAQAIAQEIQVKLTPQEKAHLTSPHPVNPEAQEAYLRGRYWDQKGEYSKAFDYYQQATERDPNYAAAYAALANHYGLEIAVGLIPYTEGKSKWRAAVVKALELDDTLAEAHVSLAALLLYHDGNVREAEKEFKRAFQLNPNLPEARGWHSDGLRVTGRLEEAVAEARQAQRLDPYSSAVTKMLGINLIAAGRYDEALEEGRKMLEWDALNAHSMLGLAYEQKGDLDQAISEFQQTIKLDIGNRRRAAVHISDLAHAFAVSGRKNEALRLLTELTESKHGFIGPWAIAVVYTGLGDKDRAFETLEKGVDEHRGIEEIKTDPRMAPLRSDPRYQELLRRMGLSP
jgi:tetratricopeptide (TPR) repeat protein